MQYLCTINTCSAGLQQPLPVLEKGKDPLAPKPNKTPFNFFSVDARVKAKDSFPEMSQTDITKKVGTRRQCAINGAKERGCYRMDANSKKSCCQMLFNPTLQRKTKSDATHVKHSSEG